MRNNKLVVECSEKELKKRFNKKIDTAEKIIKELYIKDKRKNNLNKSEEKI